MSDSLSRDQLLHRLEAAVEGALIRAEAVLGRRLARPEAIELMRGRSAGACVTPGRPRSRYRLRFNEQASREHWEYIRDVTVPHELAHWLVRLRHGGRVRPHGPEWQAVMRDVFGVDPSRTHDLPLRAARRQRRFQYACACGKTFSLTTTRHNRMLRFPKYYTCSACGGALNRVDT